MADWKSGRNNKVDIGWTDEQWINTGILVISAAYPIPYKCKARDNDRHR